MIPFLMAVVLQGAQAIPLSPQSKPAPTKVPRFIAAPKAGADGWSRSRVTPEAIARRCDDALRKASGISAMTNAIYDFGVGSGTSSGSIAIKDSTHYRIEYPFIPKGERRSFEKQALVAGVGRFAILSLSGWSGKAPLGRRPNLVPSTVLSKWPLNGSQYIFASVGSAESPFSQLVSEARRRGSGMKVVSEDRSLRSSAGVLVLRRVLITGGGRMIEITIDAKSGLPTTLRATGKEASGKSFRGLFAIRWNLASGQKFDPALFSVPK